MKRRCWPQHLHIALASGVLFAILVLVYQIAARHNRRLDFTREKMHSVSPETLEVLSRMESNDLVIRAFFAGEDPARRNFEILLKEIATHHPHFHYEFYDPDRSPSEARRFHVDSYRTVVAEFGTRQERFQGYTEEALTNVLIRAAHPRKRTLCFTQGHGELVLTDPERNGTSQWKQLLEDHQYQAKEIEMATEGIPSECTGVVMAGPRYELLPQEVDLLEKIVLKGKGLLLLIDPMDPGEGKSFARLLESFGIKLGENVVVDKASQIFGGDWLTPLVSQYAEHPITKRFDAATFFPIARTVMRSPEVRVDVEVTELASTTSRSWAETDLKRLEKGEAEPDPGTDLIGPVPVALAVTVREASKGARLVVVGDSDFVTNAHLGLAGNKDFILNILQWLARDDRWISIRMKEPRLEPLFLKGHESMAAAVFTIGALPFTALALGSVGIWIRQRKSV